jgi:hypothetical protein
MHVPVFWSRIVTLAAAAGLTPFLVGLAITLNPAWAPVEMQIFERALIGFGALILSFLGGVRWGIRMQGGAGTDLTFIIGIFGSIAGFFTLLMPYTFGLIILTIGFAMQGAWDVWSGGVPQFYAKLRAVMTWLVCIILLAILIARMLVPTVS